MFEPLIKNVEHAKVVDFQELVQYQEGQVVSRTLSQLPKVTMTLFAFPAGEGLSTHKAPGDALVQVLDGEAEVTIDGTPHIVKGGESIVMPADIPHGLKAVKNFKMLLTLIKP